MRFMSYDGSTRSSQSLVCLDGCHAGRLANNNRTGLGDFTHHAFDHRGCTHTANFFIIAKGKVYGVLQARAEHIRHRGQPNGDERFHIAGATPIQLAILLCYDEGIAVPGLAVYRHHIGMPRQDNATFYIRAYGGKQIRLFAILRSEEHTSELQSLMRISYAVFCLKKKKKKKTV